MHFAAKSFACVVLTMLMAMTLPAVSITITDVTGSWFEAIPSTNVTINNGADVSTARWGAPGDTQKSGYIFDAEIPPSATVTLPPNPTDWMKMGLFTHENYPITAGTSITNIKLALQVDFSIGATPFTRVFTYVFTHDETPNAANPCKYPEGDNTNGCADAVFIGAPSGGTFMIGDVTYTLELSFSAPGTVPTDPINKFVTKESAANKAEIFGRFTSDIPDIDIPEPATFALIGFGLLALALRRKRA